MPITEWANFFVAIVSAAAALTGLIFVGVSLSLNKILDIGWLTGRAMEALVLLVGVLIAGVICLVPRQTPTIVGIEILITGGVIWGMTFFLDLRMLRQVERNYKRYYLLNILFTQLAVLPYLVAGIVLLKSGFGGLYWLVPGLLFSFLKSLTDAWILLVEIHR
nr:hypothetical protein [uncultured Dyadobacter sp.]